MLSIGRGCCGEVVDSALEVTTVLIEGSGDFIEWATRKGVMVVFQIAFI